MNPSIGFEKCLNFINTHAQPPGAPLPVPLGRTVTISRQSACGAHVLAEKLAAYLEAHSPAGAPRWTIFDRDLMEKVLADHHLPEKIARFMPEDRVSKMEDILYDVFDVRPDSWTLIHHTSETILGLAKLGNVILLGRGANVIAAKVPGSLHVRLVAPLETRIRHMCHFEGLPRPKALERIQREDLGRARYLRKYFNRDIDDATLYHLVINMDMIPQAMAAQLIGNLLLHGAGVPATAETVEAKVCV